MITLERITKQNVPAFREIRLRALREDPGAFGSTYAMESQLTEDGWMARTARWDGVRGIGYLARDSGECCGIAGCYLDPNDGARAQLVSMWTAPTHRQRGVGRLLVDAVIDWARERQARSMLLMVTSHNHSALLFYQRLGFTNTGRTEPYPNDPAVLEYEMSLPLL